MGWGDKCVEGRGASNCRNMAQARHEIHAMFSCLAQTGPEVASPDFYADYVPPSGPAPAAPPPAYHDAVDRTTYPPTAPGDPQVSFSADLPPGGCD